LEILLIPDKRALPGIDGGTLFVAAAAGTMEGVARAGVDLDVADLAGLLQLLRQLVRGHWRNAAVRLAEVAQHGRAQLRQQRQRVRRAAVEHDARADVTAVARQQ